MSLINDALKKAQSQRGGDTASGMLPGEVPRAPQRRSMVGLAVGAIALVGVSVGLTVFLVNRPAPTAEKSVASVPAAAATVPSSAPATLPTAEKSAPENAATPTKEGAANLAATNAPASTPNATASVPAAPKAAETVRATPPANIVPGRAASTAAVARPTPASPTPVTTAPAAVEQAPVTTAPAVAEAPLPAANGPQDERIHQFIDALKIAGVKAAGNDSRVLMNDHFYRVNEIVDRSLGLRLIKVEADRLTFSDANGVTYARFF